MEPVFTADPGACVACGECAADCVTGIVKVENGLARVDPADAGECIGCQHCLAVCPTAAVSVKGLDPKNSVGLDGFKPDAANLELLVKGRRSIRRFRPEPVPAALLNDILETVSYAPTGVNWRRRRFTVVHDRPALDEFRDRLCRALAAAGDKLPTGAEWLPDAARAFLDGGDDMIFRGAPHFLVTTVEAASPCAEVDAAIAAAYFDLVAQSRGVGTVWAGMIYNCLRFIPESRDWLGIPPDHQLGYAVLFGLPAVSYARTAQYRPEDAVFVSKLRD